MRASEGVGTAQSSALGGILFCGLTSDEGEDVGPVGLFCVGAVSTVDTRLDVLALMQAILDRSSEEMVGEALGASGVEQTTSTTTTTATAAVREKRPGPN